MSKEERCSRLGVKWTSVEVRTRVIRVNENIEFFGLNSSDQEEERKKEKERDVWFESYINGDGKSDGEP